MTDLCECPICGRNHKSLHAGPPPFGAELMAKTLDKEPDYRVMRRLGSADLTFPGAQEDEKTFHGLYVDVESTGLDTDKDEVIELSIYPFLFANDGRIVDVGDPLHYYEEPKSREITKEITELTKITPEMVAGREIDWAEARPWIEKAHLIVAHHAEFDRKMLERLHSTFEKKCWGCSMSEPPWKEHGITGRRLEYVLASLGRFYEAHNSTVDCAAGIFALSAMLGEHTALHYIMESARKPTWHVWALRAPFDVKDALKSRGYFWNGGEDGRHKAWHKEIPDSERAAEEKWLATNVYRGARMGLDGGYELPARFDKVTAYERFSKRG